MKYLFSESENKRFSSLKLIISWLVGLAAALSIVYFALNPVAADFLAREDGPIENLSAFFLLLASLLMVIYGIKLLSKKLTLAAIAAFFVGLVLFVIGMEEISWMQRILDVESSEFFLQNNMQAEMNFHNLNTTLSEYTYYFGSFLILIALPFFRRPVKRLLYKIKLSSLATLLPSRWIIIPTSLMMAFITPGTSSSVLMIIGTVFTLVALLVLIFTADFGRYKIWFSLAALLAIIAIFVGWVLFLTIDYQDLGIRHWAASEYREMFIGLGFLIYAVDRSMNFINQSEKSKLSAKRTASRA